MTVHMSDELKQKLLSSVEIPSSPSTAPVAEPFYGMIADPVYDTALQWFKKLTYRPDTTMEFNRYENGAYRGMYAGTITFYRMVENSYRPGEHMRLQFHNMVPSYLCENEAQFIDFVSRCLEEFEIHEAREWFKVNGQVYNDPHDPQKGWKADAEKVKREARNRS